jgi:hypothetical protein
MLTDVYLWRAMNSGGYRRNEVQKCPETGKNTPTHWLCARSRSSGWTDLWLLFSNSHQIVGLNVEAGCQDGRGLNGGGNGRGFACTSPRKRPRTEDDDEEED